MIESRTIYSIKDEVGERTTITLDKLIADVLQASLSDVHSWIQRTYASVAKSYPEISRRKKGDIVRVLSVKEAQKFPLCKELIDRTI